jgi:hypothetical protein
LKKAKDEAFLGEFANGLRGATAAITQTALATIGQLAKLTDAFTQTTMSAD